MNNPKLYYLWKLMKNIHIVFDLDGTLANTQKIHQEIESEFLHSKWVNIDPNTIGEKYAGRSPSQRIPEFLKQESIFFEASEIEDFIESKDNKVIELLHTWKIELMPFAEETLKLLSKKWCKIWIASGSCRQFINDFISYFNFENIIEASTSANEVKNKKPAPDVFINSFKILEEKHWKSDEKFVIGDGKSDIIWWNLAGAKTIFYNNSQMEISDEIENILDFTITNFEDLPNIIYK